MEHAPKTVSCVHVRTEVNTDAGTIVAQIIKSLYHIDRAQWLHLTLNRPVANKKW